MPLLLQFELIPVIVLLIELNGPLFASLSRIQRADWNVLVWRHYRDGTHHRFEITAMGASIGRSHGSFRASKDWRGAAHRGEAVFWPPLRELNWGFKNVQ